jgi:hypothetical protein
MEDFPRPLPRPHPVDIVMCPSLDAYAAAFAAQPEVAGDGVLPVLTSAHPPAAFEHQRIMSRLVGYSSKDSGVWREIVRRFGKKIKQPELVSIAAAVAHSADVRLDRDAKRRKKVLIKWFEEHWAAIAPFLDYVVLENR